MLLYIRCFRLFLTYPLNFYFNVPRKPRRTANQQSSAGNSAPKDQGIKKLSSPNTMKISLKDLHSPISNASTKQYGSLSGILNEANIVMLNQVPVMINEKVQHVAALQSGINEVIALTRISHS
jgi:hypothetical protein